MRRSSTSDAFADDQVKAALAALDAAELRAIVRDALRELEGRAATRVVSVLLERAARAGSGWVPTGPDGDEVEEAVAFAAAAKRAGRADPADVDVRLQRGVAAFLRRDYAAAHRILGALLPPIAVADIDLGQDELVDEVLGVDPDQCALRYVVSTYMVTGSERRARAVRAAIDAVRDLVWRRQQPIAQMERVAMEPLPDLARFLEQWRALMLARKSSDRLDHRLDEADGWLREVVQRLDGAAGLADVARSSRQPADLLAWCRAVVATQDPKAALAAYEEAAELARDHEHARGQLRDGAALAAQRLGIDDLSPWLERAWRAAPTAPRLWRWLAAGRNAAQIVERAAVALEACSDTAQRQRAFLHLLQRDFAAAADLLASAPGLGWSGSEHPGHLLFSVLPALLEAPSRRVGNSSPPHTRAVPEYGDVHPPLEELELRGAGQDAPYMPAAAPRDILSSAGVEGIDEADARRTVLLAMRRAAENRARGLAESKRSKYYGHAAQLVAICVACDSSPDAQHWLAVLRSVHRRRYSLQAELDRRLRDQGGVLP